MEKYMCECELNFVHNLASWKNLNKCSQCFYYTETCELTEDSDIFKHSEPTQVQHQAQFYIPCMNVFNTWVNLSPSGIVNELYNTIVFPIKMGLL